MTIEAFPASEATPPREVLVADCGGTNTRLQLYQVPAGHKNTITPRTVAPGKLIAEQHYLNKDYGSFKHLIQHFLSASTTSRPVTACFAVAGPVENNKVVFTNRSWTVDGAEIEADLGIRRVRLINDFVANGYGLLTLDTKTECETLQVAPQIVGAPIACVGAGTGLGETFCTAAKADAPYEAYPSEGGHAEFVPRSELESELAHFLMLKFGEKHRVSVERVVSGPGIASVYEFYSTRFSAKAHPTVRASILTAGEMQARVIANHAKRDARPFCAVCEMAMETFAAAYGSECGAAALKWIPLGGLYVAGGIAIKNMQLLRGDDSPFMRAFRDKGRLSPLIKRVPLHVVKVDDIGQRGAHLVAVKLLSDVRNGRPVPHPFYRSATQFGMRMITGSSERIVEKPLRRGGRALVGDIGGTNSRLQLIEIEAGSLAAPCKVAPGRLVAEQQYLNGDYPSFEEIVRVFLESSGETAAPTTACFAVAGPVEDNRVTFTNRESWVIDGGRISEELGIGSVRLINDFVANGYGLLTLDIGTECETLQASTRVKGAPIACVGAGTGLGETFCTAAKADAPYEAYPSEGGHAEFVPRSELESELAHFLMLKFGEKHRISVERVVSGPGIASVYEFYSTRFSAKAHPAVRASILTAGEMQARVIANHAKRDARPFCAVCEMAMETFAAAYGSECGAAALKWIPLGGLYVAGGIAIKNMQLLRGDDSPFMRAFRDKGRLSPLIKRVPLHVVKVDNIGQRGAHLMAFRLMQELCELFAVSPALKLSVPPIVRPEGSDDVEPPVIPRSVASGDISPSLREFVATKHSPFKGSYTRVLAVSQETISTLDPKHRAATNTWSIADVLGAKAMHSESPGDNYRFTLRLVQAPNQFWCLPVREEQTVTFSVATLQQREELLKVISKVKIAARLRASHSLRSSTNGVRAFA